MRIFAYAETAYMQLCGLYIDMDWENICALNCTEIMRIWKYICAYAEYALIRMKPHNVQLHGQF